MKRVLITIILIGIIYVLGQMIFSGMNTFMSDASIIMSGISQNEIETVVREHYNVHILDEDVALSEDANIIATPAYIDNDKTLDIVVRVESEATCGTGGCITTLFKRAGKSLIALPFEYAVKEIAVMESVTNHMHDIKINNNTVLTWDGNRYSMNGM
jgi:hypothetical protein